MRGEWHRTTLARRRACCKGTPQPRRSCRGPRLASCAALALRSTQRRARGKVEYRLALAPSDLRIRVSRSGLASSTTSAALSLVAVIRTTRATAVLHATDIVRTRMRTRALAPGAKPDTRVPITGSPSAATRCACCRRTSPATRRRRRRSPRLRSRSGGTPATRLPRAGPSGSARAAF